MRECAVCIEAIREHEKHNHHQASIAELVWMVDHLLRCVVCFGVFRIVVSQQGCERLERLSKIVRKARLGRVTRAIPRELSLSHFEVPAYTDLTVPSIRHAPLNTLRGMKEDFYTC